MLGLSNDQLMAFLRQVVPLVAGVLVTLGWISPEHVSEWTAYILAIGGPILAIIGITAAFIANTKKSIIASATKMEEVDSKKLAGAIQDPTLKAVAMAEGTSPPKDDASKSSNK